MNEPYLHEQSAAPVAVQPPTSTYTCKVIDPSTFRGLVKEVSGRTITSKQAANLLDVFGQDLEADVTTTIRRFVGRHFGKESGTTK